LILNVGCGAQGFGEIRVDKYRNAANIITDIEKGMPFRENTFEIVYSRFLFEHMRNPSFVLSEMVRVLKPEGKLILITDNASYFPFYLAPSLGSGFHAGGYEGRGPEDKHYSIFTKEHIINHLIHAGLENIVINYVYADKVGGKSGAFQKVSKFLKLDHFKFLEPFCKANIFASGVKPLKISNHYSENNNE
jgi:ubiquinone/menaquinone biosynthesis C-methylase UbiE